MSLSIAALLSPVRDLSHQMRRLRFFDGYFRRTVATIARLNGLEAEIDTTRLTAAFLDWAEDFERQRQFAAENRRDFTIFSAGLMVYHLISHEVVTARPAPGTERPSEQAAVWPAGFLVTSFAVTALDAVLAEPGGLPVSRMADEARFWQSFRETAATAPEQAIALFDLILGGEPGWSAPSVAGLRPAMRGPHHHSRPGLVDAAGYRLT